MDSVKESKPKRRRLRGRSFSHKRRRTIPRPAVLHAVALRVAIPVFALAAILTAVSVLWIDRPLALTVAHSLPPGKTVPMQVPDLLIWFVIAVTGLGVLLWAWARWSGEYPRLLRLAPLVVLIEPLSLGVKYVAKWFFGRTQTRLYINHPWAHDFHWLHGHGPYLSFPSGHMLVATALIVVIVAVFPRLRPLGWLALAALGAALVLTSYHYLGDVIAGWLFGATLAWIILSADARLRPTEAPRTRP